MKFGAEDYYRASVERMREAREIHKRGESYALAMYTGGLAVECLLRAFRWHQEAAFEGRHDLRELLKASELLRSNEEAMRRKGVRIEDIEETSRSLHAAISEVVILWHNNLRFASEANLRSNLDRIGRIRGIKGDALRKNSDDLLNAAQTLIDRGTTLWILKKK